MDYNEFRLEERKVQAMEKANNLKMLELSALLGREANDCAIKLYKMKIISEDQLLDEIEAYSNSNNAILKALKSIKE